MMNKMILLTFSLFVGTQIQTLAQCPGCIATDCSATNADGGLCDTIFIGMANHPIDEQISFYMPKRIFSSLVPGGGGFVTLRRIEITGVTGLPLGMDWESNRFPNNEYFPASGDTIGCVRMCGIPLQADTFPLTVFLLADVTANVLGSNIDVNNQSQTYNNALVIILPDTAGGVSSFSIDPNINTSCNPLTLAFEAKIDGSPNPTEYSWDFGNGNIDMNKFPADQTFSTPDTYPVTLTTTIMEYVVTEFKVLSASGWFPDIEELTAIQNPDMYFTIPALGYQSSEKAEQAPPVTWSNLDIHIPAGIDSIEIEVWDSDGGPPFGSQDDLLARTKIPLSVNNLAYSGSNAAGSIAIEDTIGSQFSETLNIVIGTIPQGVLTAQTSDSICVGDSTLLVITGSNIGTYIWFRDSVLIPGSTDSLLWTKGAGTYWVELLSPMGCRNVSSTTAVNVIPLPPVPSIIYLSAVNELKANNANAFGIEHIQWYLFGDSINGATSPSLVVDTPGIYSLSYANILGCSTLSDAFEVIAVGIENKDLLNEMNVTIYPNPSNGVFNLNFNIENIQDVSIKIYNEIGQLLKEDKLGKINGKYVKKISIPTFNKGVFFIQVLSEKSKITKKLVLFE